MSDQIVGTAVLEKQPGKPEQLLVCCLAEGGRRAGKGFLITIPVAEEKASAAPSEGTGPWRYKITGSRITVWPSLLCRESVWDEARRAFGKEMVQTFHSGTPWTVDFVECSDGDAFERFMELNPGC